MHRKILRALVLALVITVTFFDTKTVNANINSSNGIKTTELATWAVPLTITADGITITRTFGGDPNATDGYDSGLDVQAAPPGMTYYTYFEIAQFPNFLDTDVRAWVSPYETDIDWTLKIVNSAGKTSTLAWDPANLPTEGAFTLEGANGSVDMRSQNSVNFSGDKTLTIKYRYVPPVGGWAVPLAISGNGVNFTCSFGGNANATDGYDPGLDVQAAPPGMTYYSYFEIVQFPNFLQTDIRAWVSPYESDIDWTLKIVNAVGKTSTISWDPSNLPIEGIFTMEGANGSIDMRSQNSVTFSGDRTLSIKYRFMIPPSITVTSPNGGENWSVGNSYDITWTSSNFTNPVKIEYSIDGGVNWLSPPIAGSTPNDGSYPWTIPDTPSSICKVRISDAIDGDPLDISDDVFTISLPLVWPGDTNNSGLVDANDVQPLLLHFNLAGPVRPAASMDWMGQSCPVWTPLEATYADANGDGMVNTIDVLPIGLNYNKVHPGNLLPPNSPSSHENMIQLNPRIKPEVGFISGDTFRVDINVQDLDNLLGISFELLYSEKNYISSDSVLIDPFMGNDLVALYVIDKESGKVSIGASRKAGQGGVSNNGTIAQILMIGNKVAPEGTQVDLLLQKVVAIDPNGNPIDFIVENGEFVTAVESTNESFLGIPKTFCLYQNYPNPFNPTTNIQFQTNKNVKVTLKIYDVLGQEICTLVDEERQAGYYETIWDGKDGSGKNMASGIYIFTLQAGDFLATKKMILLR